MLKGVEINSYAQLKTVIDNFTKSNQPFTNGLADEFKRLIQKYSSIPLKTPSVLKMLRVGSFNIGRLAKSAAGGLIDFDVPLLLNGVAKNLQRPLVWTLEQKQELIATVLKCAKLPLFVICTVLDERVKNAQQFYQIIDGKQRLSSILDFVNNKFPINFGGVSYHFKDLDLFTQNLIILTNIDASVCHDYIDETGHTISDMDKLTMFEFINFKGTPMDAEHLKNLRG